MSVFWLFASLTVAVLLFTGNDGGRINKDFAPWAIGIGILLACYNFVRWWVGRSAAKNRQSQSPPEKRPAQPTEYHPEFDFNRPDAPEQTNGQKNVE